MEKLQAKNAKLERKYWTEEQNQRAMETLARVTEHELNMARLKNKRLKAEYEVLHERAKK
jgi:hypothetical protein